MDCSFDWSGISPATGPCMRPGGTALTGRALKACNLPLGAHLIDVGCGTGGTLEYLGRKKRFRLTGLDFSEPLLRQADTRLGNGSLVRGAGETLPFKEDTFDALFCECVLSILGDRVAALSEFARVLRAGGFIIVSDAFIGSRGRERKEAPTPQRVAPEKLLVREELWKLLSDLGFSVILWEEHDRLLKTFVASMILAGGCLPDSWRRTKARECGEKDRSAISYFLLVARKQNHAILHLGA